jgi:hypothetical protein
MAAFFVWVNVHMLFNQGLRMNTINTYYAENLRLKITAHSA